MKTETIIIIGAACAGFLLLNKGKIGTTIGETAGNLVVDTTEGFINTVFPENILHDPYRWAQLDHIYDFGNWIKNIGNDDAWWY